MSFFCPPEKRVVGEDLFSLFRRYAVTKLNTRRVPGSTGRGKDFGMSRRYGAER